MKPKIVYTLKLIHAVTGETLTTVERFYTQIEAQRHKLALLKGLHRKHWLRIDKMEVE